MKLISLVLSLVLFFNQAMASSPSVADYNVEFEKKLFDAVVKWNGASTYGQLIEQLPASKGDKSLLRSLARKYGVERQKPVNLEYIPSKNKLFAHFKKETVPFWILANHPTILVYDRQKILEIKPKASIASFFTEEQKNLKPSPKEKSDIKSNPHSSKGAMLWSLFNPQAKALTAEQATELEAQYKKEAERQTKFVKTLLWVTLFSFVGFIALFWAWGKFAHLLNPAWGVEGAANKREGIAGAKANFPDIEQTLFSAEEPLDYFECEDVEKSSPLKKIRFKGKDHAMTEFNIDGDGDKLKGLLAKKDSFAPKLEKAEYCCQHHPCGAWLAQHLAGEVPGYYDHKNSTETGSR